MIPVREWCPQLLLGFIPTECVVQCDRQTALHVTSIAVCLTACYYNINSLKLQTVAVTNAAHRDKLEM